MRLALIALAGITLTFAVAWLGGTIAAWPRTGSVGAFDPPAETLTLRSRDGTAIAATHWPGATPDGPAVLLLHGINNDRRSLAGHAEWLNELGYGVLAIDFRGHGESGAAERTFGWREADDAAAALAWMRRGRPHRAAGVIGVSLGGAAALIGRDGPLPVQAMVLHAVYPDIRTAVRNRLERSGSTALAWLGEPLLSFQSHLRYGIAPDRIAPAAAIRDYPGAVLVIGGREDRDTRVADTLALHAAAPGEKQLWLLPGLGHVETSTLWTDAYRARIAAFFARHLGVPEASTPGR